MILAHITLQINYIANKLHSTFITGRVALRWIVFESNQMKSFVIFAVLP